MTPAPAAATPLAPLGVISHNNQSGLIAILTALSLCFVLVSLIIRVYVRRINGPWNWDDNILALATVISFAQSGLVFFEISKGLGKALSLVNNDDYLKMQKAYYANNFLYLTVLFLSKASICILYLRLTPSRRHVWILRSILGFLFTWTIISILLLTIKCSWREQCANLFDRWLIIAVLDCVSEVALAMFALELVRGLQMRISSKAIVVAAFSSRLLVIPACAVRLYYLNPNTLTSNPTFALSLAVVCTQLQLGYGVMAASIPCLKPFVAVYERPAEGSTAAKFYTADSARKSTANRSGGSRSGTDKDRGIKLQSLTFNTSVNVGSNLNKSESRVSVTDPLSWKLRPDAQGSYVATISVPGKDQLSRSNSRNRYGGGVTDDDISIRSHDSRRMIIERQTEFSVQYQHESGSVGDERSEDGIQNI